LTGLGAFARLARVGAWSAALSIPVIAALAAWQGANGALAGLTAALGISCVANGWALRGECRRFGIPVSWSGFSRETRVLFGFSLPSYISGLLVAPVAWFANAMLVRGGGGFTEMALFTAADRYRFLLIFVPLAVSRTAVPALARARAAGDRDGFAQTLRWNLIASTISTLIPVLCCVAAAAPLMALFGESFRPAWLVLAVLALSAIPTVLNTQLGAALLSAGRAWERAAADALLAGAFLALAWWAVPRWGAVGLAATFAGAYSIACLALAMLLRRGTRE